jgi:hypothetical protein
MTRGEIEKTFSRECNIGFVTGNVSGGLVVLDVDKPNGGIESIKQLQMEHGYFPPTPCVNTGGGGQHYYFRHAGNLRCSAGKLGVGIDVRAEGGVVIAPPSVHPNGTLYMWAEGFSPDDLQLADLPSWVVEATTTKRPANHKITNAGELDSGNRVTRGKRRIHLLSKAGSMQHAGFHVAAITAALLAENRLICTPPLDANEVEELANDLSQRYPRGDLASGSLNFQSVAEWNKEPEKPVEWLVEGLIARGQYTVLAAFAKVGKSTFARALSVSVAEGSRFLDREVQQGNVLYMALEENPAMVRTAFRNLGATAATPLSVHHGRVPPDTWTELEALLKGGEPPALLVIDTVGRVRKKGAEDFNSYGEMADLLEPLMYLSHETETAILALHHTGKAGKNSKGYDGLAAILGSMNIIAMADQIIGMVRNSKTGQRTYYTEGRMLGGIDNIQSTVLRMDSKTGILSAVGTEKEVALNNVKGQIIRLLEDGPMTSPMLTDRIDSRKQEVLSVLRRLHDDGLLHRTGEGKSGSPYEYCLPDGAAK